MMTAKVRLKWKCDGNSNRILTQIIHCGWFTKQGATQKTMKQASSWQRLSSQMKLVVIISMWHYDHDDAVKFCVQKESLFPLNLSNFWSDREHFLNKVFELVNSTRFTDLCWYFKGFVNCNLKIHVGQTCTQAETKLCPPKETTAFFFHYHYCQN